MRAIDQAGLLIDLFELVGYLPSMEEQDAILFALNVDIIDLDAYLEKVTYLSRGQRLSTNELQCILECDIVRRKIRFLNDLVRLVSDIEIRKRPVSQDMLIHYMNLMKEHKDNARYDEGYSNCTACLEYLESKLLDSKQYELAA